MIKSAAGRRNIFFSHLNVSLSSYAGLGMCHDTVASKFNKSTHLNAESGSFSPEDIQNHDFC